MSSAWIFQKAADVRQYGEAGAPWYVNWYEPDGRRKAKAFGAGEQGKKRAERFRSKVENELMAGTYQMQVRKLWPDFRREYERRVLAGLAPPTRERANVALDHFERIVKPVRVFAINTGHIGDFIARRRLEPGKKKGSTVSPASVNSDLRQLKAALNVAEEWGYLPKAPRFRMERVPRRLARFVTGEHFAAIYAACDAARMPERFAFAPADWWRALIVTAYMTGWRIGQILALRREDLDLEAGTALTRAEDNKGKRDVILRLHPVVIEHLKKLPGFTPTVLPWNHDRRTLYEEFLRIQQAARVKNAAGEDVPLHLPCHGEHQHTAHCHVYGFHDLRRAFATMNADKLTPDALQALMQHKSYQTTQVYINMARQVQDAVASLHVPDVLKKAGGAG
jgi:integrase